MSWQLCAVQVETLYHSDEPRLGKVSGTSFVFGVTGFPKWSSNEASLGSEILASSAATLTSSAVS